jgi:hypothetical protein
MFTISNREFAIKFDIGKFMLPVNNNFASYFDVTDSEFLRNLQNNMEMRPYTIVKEVGRPDLLSESCYGSGNTELWWILMIINNMRLPTDLTLGKIIYYPSLRLLEDIYTRLTNKTVDSKFKNLSNMSITTSTKL